jgi:pimeloyl-ACP methyl ester carboxylesterase
MKSYMEGARLGRNSSLVTGDLPPSGAKNRPFVSQAALASLGEWDLRPEMKDVKVPALVLEGAETNVPLDATREWVKSLPNSRLLLIPNAGHGSWIDQLEAVISAMDEFFRGNCSAEITK